MTIQVVDISALGIVCAADSAITFEGTDKRGQQSWPKLFHIDRLEAVIGYYGYAAVGNQEMPNWLDQFMHRTQARSLDNLAFELRDKLNREWTPPPNGAGTGFHLAGMTLVDQVRVPSFYHIWNHNGVNGGYRATDAGFRATPDFLGRDAAEYAPNNLHEFFEKTWSQVYRNGALQPYNELAHALYDFTPEVWTKGLLQRPRKIEDWAWYYRFQLETVKLMYRHLTKKKHPPIGRRIKVLTIDPEGRGKELPQRRRKTG
jgi:hypothetical protein